MAILSYKLLCNQRGRARMESLNYCTFVKRTMANQPQLIHTQAVEVFLFLDMSLSNVKRVKSFPVGLLRNLNSMASQRKAILSIPQLYCERRAFALPVKKFQSFSFWTMFCINTRAVCTTSQVKLSMLVKTCSASKSRYWYLRYSTNQWQLNTLASESRATRGWLASDTRVTCVRLASD